MVVSVRCPKLSQHALQAREDARLFFGCALDRLVVARIPLSRGDWPRQLLISCH
jgi:hypothetical protein